MKDFDTVMRLHQLKCFITLTETLHFTDAANQLYISQPSLSYAISTLEEELGVRLFEKNGKEITTSKYGEAFLPFARTAVNSLDAGRLQLKDMLNPTNIRLGYIYSLSFDFLPSILSFLSTLDEDNKFTFSFYQGLSEDLIHKIQTDKLDLAFSPFQEGENISSVPIFSQDIYLVVPKSHRLADQKEVDLLEIKDENFALIQSGTNLRYVIDKIFHEKGITPKIVFEGEECNSIASFVGSNYGISIIPKIASLESYNLSFLRLKGIPMIRKIYLIWKKDSGMEQIIKKIKVGLAGYNNSQKEDFDLFRLEAKNDY